MGKPDIIPSNLPIKGEGMLDGIRKYLIEIFRIFLILDAVSFILLLSLCGKESATGQTDPDDTLDLKDSVTLSAVPSTGSVTISWKSNDSLTYALYWSENPGVTTATTRIMNVTSPYTHAGLKSNSTYYYRLASIDDGTVIGLSDEMKVTTRQINEVPKTVTLYASGGDKRVVLFWDNLAKPITCTIFWSKNSGFTPGNCEKITAHENPYVHANLLNDITYYYRIAVVDADGQESDWSEEVEAYTHATTEIPTFPTNVNVQERNTMLTLSWTPDGSATAYYIYWAKSSGVDKNCSREKSVTNVFHFSNLVNGTAYYLRISAENSEGEGQLSKEASGTPKLLEPPRLKAEPGYDAVVLTWPMVSNANSFNLTCRVADAAHPDTFENVRSPFTHENLDPDVDYHYRMVAVNLDGASAPCTLTASPLGLTTPGRVTVDTTGYRTVTITWDPVKFSDSYVVYWSDTTITSPSAAEAAVDVGNERRFTHTDLIPQQVYRYRVRAVKGSDSSDLSYEYKYTAKGLPAPRGVRLVAGYKEVTVVMDSAYAMPDKSPARFHLYWADTLRGYPGSALLWIGSNGVEMVDSVTLPYTMSGLEIHHYYCFALGAADGEFEGDLTNILTTTTLDLSPPDSLKVANGGYKELSLSWKSVDGADAYNIYWSSGDSVTKSSEKFSAERSPFVHTGLTIGTRYYYRMASVDGDYEGPLNVARSCIVSALNPPSTVNLIAGVNEFTLSWNAVAAAESYNVYWSRTDDVSKSSEKFSCSRTDTVLENLLPEARYYFAVTSLNGSDESGLSAVRSNVTIRLLPPTGTSLSSGYRSMHVKWNKAQYASSYNVYYSENSNVDTTSSKESVTGDSIDLTGLTPRRTYYFRISSVKGTCESALSTSVNTITGGLVVPYIITDTALYRAVSITFNRVPYAESYIVAWADTNHAAGPVDSIPIDDTVFALSDLKPLRLYYYTISAVRGEDRSPPPSGVNYIRPDGLTVPETRVSDIYKGNQIYWKRVKYADSYRLIWSDTLLTVGTLHTVTTTDTFFTNEDLLPNKIYWYQVTAVRGDDESQPSDFSRRAGGLTPPSLSLTLAGSAVRITASTKFAERLIIYWAYENSVTIASDTLIKESAAAYLDHPFDPVADSGKTRYYRAVEVRGEETGEMSFPARSILLEP